MTNLNEVYLVNKKWYSYKTEDELINDRVMIEKGLKNLIEIKGYSENSVYEKGVLDIMKMDLVIINELLSEKSEPVQAIKAEETNKKTVKTEKIVKNIITSAKNEVIVSGIYFTIMFKVAEILANL